LRVVLANRAVNTQNSATYTVGLIYRPKLPIINLYEKRLKLLFKRILEHNCRLKAMTFGAEKSIFPE